MLGINVAWAIFFVLIFFALIFILIYNNLIQKRNEVRNAFAQIDVQLTRRYELIPNLVEIAKRYLKHEQETLTAVIAARNHAVDMLKTGKVENTAAITQAENTLNSRLGGLYATFENYPDLKADGQMSALREEIASTENRVAFSRQYFNDSVTLYNNALQSFPGNIVAHCFHFQPSSLLEFEDRVEKSKPIHISFNA